MYMDKPYKKEQDIFKKGRCNLNILELQAKTMTRLMKSMNLKDKSKFVRYVVDYYDISKDEFESQISILEKEFRCKNRKLERLQADMKIILEQLDLLRTPEYQAQIESKRIFESKIKTGD